MGKGKMGKGSAGAFSEEQTEMYRECFKLMDIDKDGTINKNDLRAAFDNVGKIFCTLLIFCIGDIFNVLSYVTKIYLIRIILHSRYVDVRTRTRQYVIRNWRTM